MAEDYRFEKEAEDDFNQAFDWYEERQKGIGDKFAKKVFQKIDHVCKKPDRYSTFYKDFRKASLDKFPFNLIYRFKDKFVNILAVWHKSRSEDNLTKRIDKK